MKKVLVLLLMIGLLCVQAQALYVDAEPGTAGNTVQASDGDPDAWWVNTTSPDGLWGFRAFGYDQDGVLNGATKDIYEASGTGSGTEDCMPIITTASGLTAGQLYQVDVVYWSSTDEVNSQNWNVRAGFALDSMLLFDRLGTLGTAGTPTGDTDGDRISLLGTVGTIAADINGQISVYIDDLPGTGYADRTWYEGLQLTAVPEPATLALLGLGGLLLRRKR